MLIESKIKIGYDSMFNVPQAYFKSAHLLNKMALVQFQCSRTVDCNNLIGAAHTVIMAVKKAYNQENELLACRPSPEVMIQIFMPGQATMCYG